MDQIRSENKFGFNRDPARILIAGRNARALKTSRSRLPPENSLGLARGSGRTGPQALRDSNCPFPGQLLNSRQLKGIAMISIHFVCTVCGKHLEVDEVGAGMTIFCTDCSTALMVPRQTRKYSCPHCRVAVLLPQNLWGQTIQCSSCQQAFPIPNPATATSAGLCIHFVCPACGKHLEVDESGAGVIIQCADCSTSMKVPSKTAKSICPSCGTAVLVADNLWGQAIECSACGQIMQTQNPDAPIQHSCPYCYVVVLAEKNMQGKFIECPTCHKQFRVPYPDKDVEQEGASESLF